MKKFSKKSMLGLLTASAIVATTVGSFAVWDTLETTSTGSLTVRKPVVVSTQAISNFTPAEEAGMPVYSTPVAFNVADLPASETASTLTLTPEIKNGETVVTDKFTVTIEGTGDDALTNNVDSKVGEVNNYTVKVKPNDTDDAKALADQALTVNIKAVLDAK